MSGIAIRYLGYQCDLAAGPYKYSFDVDQSKASASGNGDVQSVSRTFVPPWRKPGADLVPQSQLHAITPESLACQINKVTTIGIARFLDNSVPPYGNSIDQYARSQNERTLTAVLQAFALQYSPSKRAEDPLAQLYQSPGSDEQPVDSHISMETAVRIARVYLPPPALTHTHSL